MSVDQRGILMWNAWLRIQADSSEDKIIISSEVDRTEMCLQSAVEKDCQLAILEAFSHLKNENKTKNST